MVSSELTPIMRPVKAGLAQGQRERSADQANAKNCDRLHAISTAILDRAHGAGDDAQLIHQFGELLAGTAIARRRSSAWSGS